jgi:uncharacterized membrane protein YdbT with pleckstrin-like domain
MAEVLQKTQFDPTSFDRPHASLLTYYILISLCGLILAPFIFIPHLIKYKTMRYTFDGEGVSMKWGFFFRKEVYLTYRRLQDIHVTRNIIERWLGLAKVPIQTASGTSGATMTIEGCVDAEALRDHLYTRMRGAREGHVADGESGAHTAGHDDDDPVVLLREIRDALRDLRRERPS